MGGGGRGSSIGVSGAATGAGSSDWAVGASVAAGSSGKAPGAGVGMGSSLAAGGGVGLANREAQPPDLVRVGADEAAGWAFSVERESSLSLPGSLAQSSAAALSPLVVVVVTSSAGFAGLSAGLVPLAVETCLAPRPPRAGRSAPLPRPRPSRPPRPRPREVESAMVDVSLPLGCFFSADSHFEMAPVAW